MDTSFIGPIIGVVVGSLLTAGNQLVTSRRDHRNRLETERIAHGRALDDARAQRLRDLFGKVLMACLTLEGTSVQKGLLFHGEPTEDRDRRHTAEIEQAMLPLRLTVVALKLEMGGEDVIRASDAVISAASAFGAKWYANMNQGGTYDQETMLRGLRDITRAREGLEVILRGHLGITEPCTPELPQSGAPPGIGPVPVNGQPSASPRP